MQDVILASKSPRRKELLSQIVDNFTIDSSSNPEIIDKKWPLKDVPRHLAILKAQEVANRHPNSIVIGADTIVLIDNEILGKPKDQEDVIRMMKLLSNRTHLVITGVCLIKDHKLKSFSCITKVTFKKLTENEIASYATLDSVYDKAGAYAIQEDAKDFIVKIKGDYNNVIGLPISKLKKYLK